MLHLFKPILAGATLRDRLIACLGGALGIALASVLSIWLLHSIRAAPFLVAPIGASAVLVFAVPASPLAQPWPVIGGNAISALVGVVVARLVPEPNLAASVAVGGAILVMSLARCLHPPGGAAALTAVIGGPAITSAGFWFPFAPVAVNAAILVGAGIVFHRWSGHSYPHRPVPLATMPALDGPTGMPHPEDIDRALSDLGETFDVTREDLDLLFQRVEYHAAKRSLR